MLSGVRKMEHGLKWVTINDGNTKLMGWMQAHTLKHL